MAGAKGIAVLMLCYSVPALAYDANPAVKDRAKLLEGLQDYHGEISSLFASIPQSHILPSRDIVSVSVSVERPDYTIVPKDETVSKNDRAAPNRLDLSGWRATPLVAFSNKRFGIGFAGEAGQMQAHYLDKSCGSSCYVEEYGSAKFSGLGIYGYWIPEMSFLPKALTPLLVLGGKRLNVVHESTGTVTSKYVEKDTMRYTYSLDRYEAGLDFAILLAKRFTVLPWSSYSIVKVQSGNEKYLKGPTYDYNRALQADKELFWEFDPEFKYGVDFVVGLGSIQVHMGGLLGVVGNYVKVNERVVDNAVSVGIAYDFKSR